MNRRLILSVVLLFPIVMCGCASSGNRIESWARRSVGIETREDAFRRYNANLNHITLVVQACEERDGTNSAQSVSQNEILGASVAEKVKSILATKGYSGPTTVILIPYGDMHSNGVYRVDVKSETSTLIEVSKIDPASRTLRFGEERPGAAALIANLIRALHPPPAPVYTNAPAGTRNPLNAFNKEYRQKVSADFAAQDRREMAVPWACEFGAGRTGEVVVVVRWNVADLSINAGKRAGKHAMNAAEYARTHGTGRGPTAAAGAGMLLGLALDVATAPRYRTQMKFEWLQCDEGLRLYTESKTIDSVHAPTANLIMDVLRPLPEVTK